MKWDNELNKFMLNTEVTLIMKCCNRKIIKKIADNAMRIFLPMEDLKKLLNKMGVISHLF